MTCLILKIYSNIVKIDPVRSPFLAVPRRRRTHRLRDLTGRSCLNGAAQPRSEFCGPTLGSSTAGCPERSAGTRVAGLPSFASFSWERKKRKSPAARQAASKTSNNKSAPNQPPALIQKASPAHIPEKNFPPPHTAHAGTGFQPSTPSARVKARRAQGGQMRRRTHRLRHLTGRSCLNGAAQPRSEFCGPTLGPSTAGCPQRSTAQGHGQQGALLLLTLLARARKGSRPPRDKRLAKTKTATSTKSACSADPASATCSHG